jgi:phage terminase large subunit-like protein
MKHASENSVTPFQLTPKQNEANHLLCGPQRHSMLVGGARSGKTFLLVRAILIRALRADYSRHLIVRLRYNAIRQSVWLDTLPKVLRLCFPNIRFELHDRDGYITTPNGSEIWIGGLDDKDRTEKILGQEYCSIFFNECSQIPFGSATMALTRLAQKAGLRNRAYYDLNPVGTGHYTYRLFLEHRDPTSRRPLDAPEEYAYLFLNPVDNAPHIDPVFIEALAELPERQRKRFLSGKYLADVENALWTTDLIEKSRVSIDHIPTMQRIVIAVDPSGCRGAEDVQADQIGLVVAGLGSDDDGYIFEDATGHYSPEGWAGIVRNLYYKYGADRVIGETNFGGDMVRAVIHGADPNIAYKEVSASRGKAVRAEPISALYERGRVHHVGQFPDLEDEQCNFTSAGYTGMGSPNRADAAVWALSELMQSQQAFGLLEYMRRCQEAGSEEEFLRQYKEQCDQREQELRIKVQHSTPVTAPSVPNGVPPLVCPACGSQHVKLLPSLSGKMCCKCGHGWDQGKLPSPMDQKLPVLIVTGVTL